MRKCAVREQVAAVRLSGIGHDEGRGPNLDAMQHTTATGSRLLTYWSQPLYAVDGYTYQGLDVALAAMLRGEWSAFERRIAEGLACQRHAEHAGDVLESGALDAAAETFRYQRDLIAADEITGWLERTGITGDEWSAYLERMLWRQRHQLQLDDLLDRFPPTSRDVVTSAFVDGVCSGCFDAMAQTAAGRAALAAEYASMDATSDHLAERLAHTNAHWLISCGSSDVLSRIGRLAAVEQTFAKAVNTISTSERLAAVLESNRLDWRVIETVTLNFPTEHGAREALLCVRADGLSLYDVAAISKRPAVRQERVFADFDGDVRDRVLALDPGAVAGPYPSGDSFELLMVVSHRLPELADADGPGPRPGRTRQ